MLLWPLRLLVVFLTVVGWRNGWRWRALWLPISCILVFVAVSAVVVAGILGMDAHTPSGRAILWVEVLLVHAFWVGCLIFMCVKRPEPKRPESVVSDIRPT